MAAASISDFRDLFPEFAQTDAGLIAAHLARALVSVPEDTWGVYQFEGHAYLTAHLLATSPWGQNARLSEPDGVSTYGKRYEELRIEVAASWR